MEYLPIIVLNIITDFEGYEDEMLETTEDEMSETSEDDNGETTEDENDETTEDEMSETIEDENDETTEDENDETNEDENDLYPWPEYIGVGVINEVYWSYIENRRYNEETNINRRQL